MPTFTEIFSIQNAIIAITAIVTLILGWVARSFFTELGKKLFYAIKNLFKGKPKTPNNLRDRNPNFSGRESELKSLKGALEQTAKTGITQKTGTSGYGGMGKSSVALEFGYRALETYPGGVFWLNANAPNNIMAELASLSAALGIEAQTDQTQTAEQVCATLRQSPLSLLILDNVNNNDEWRRIQAQLPSGEHCHWLITTRAETLAEIELKPLGYLNFEETQQLLTRYRKDAAEHPDAIKTIFHWFGGFALGISTMGIYLKAKPHIQWPEYAQALRDKDDTFIHSEDHAKNSHNYEHRTQNVFDDLLETLPAGEQRMLEYAALLPADNIVEDWLTDLLTTDCEQQPKLATPEPGSTQTPAIRSLAHLLALGLLQPISERIVGLHRVLAQHLQITLDDTDLVQRWQRIAEHTEAWGENSHNALTQQVLREDLTPLSQLCQLLKAAGQIEPAANLANCIHTPLTDLARWEESERNVKPFLNAPKVSPQTNATTYISFAKILKNKGNSDDASAYMKQAIAWQKKHMGNDHLTLATSYSNLALILQDQGDLPCAREYMEHAIRLEIKHLGEEHPNLATSYANLATNFRYQKDFSNARKYMLKAITLHINYLGENHPRLAVCYSNFAIILQDQGDLSSAREYTQRAITLKIKNLGEKHPTLAISYTNLASIDYAEGDKTRACENMQRAYAIQSQHFADDHLISQDILNSMAAVCDVEALSDQEKAAIAGLAA